MKTVAVALLVLFCNKYSYSQSIYNQNLDSIIDSRGVLEKCGSLSEVAKKLFVENEKTQYLVFLKWTVNYLSYKSKSDATPLKKILDSREGDCHHYSIIMDSLCKYRGFDCGIVHGLVKSSVNKDGSFKLEAHAWTYIRFDNEVKYTDVLWSDGHSSKDLDPTFVLKGCDEFALTHFATKRKYRPKNWRFSKYMSFPLVTKKFMQIIIFDPIMLKSKYTSLADFLKRVNIGNEWSNETDDFKGFYLSDENLKLFKLNVVNTEGFFHLTLPQDWRDNQHLNYSLVIALNTSTERKKYLGLLEK